MDIALEVIGDSKTIRQAIESVGIFGRVVLVGITGEPFKIYPYKELIAKEAEVISCSDHLLYELPLLIELVKRKKLNLSCIITNKIPLNLEIINDVLDKMVVFSNEIRTVSCP